jgi:hypothetical protein
MVLKYRTSAKSIRFVDIYSLWNEVFPRSNPCGIYSEWKKRPKFQDKPTYWMRHFVLINECIGYAWSKLQICNHKYFYKNWFVNWKLSVLLKTYSDRFAIRWWFDSGNLIICGPMNLEKTDTIFEMSIESNSYLKNWLVMWGLPLTYKHMFRPSRNRYRTS